MIEIRYSPSALRDIKLLLDFIFHRNPIAAQSAISAIRNGINKLKNFPEIGKLIANLQPNFRGLKIPIGARGDFARYAVLE